ncbi:Myb-like DNA-binding domain containing protein [Trichomonas vaginalis G3]|uniref:Myb-like DNA-binding domain containing protein n=1 Tax=Trichomonas vaginalis (strain ATCC PRA-98 / G3) TaxID=412133 RepID=A2FC60_TRIV3|nr:RNA polymerase II transcription regulator recruiting protein [Trichomonas vaginalis G3]EAX97517.1 Myb-like DNA-binding domain containing protein [Trichomonas vaginalis G3]KAI5505539.1 RNA polymerase II transcription regulator recruiting protein [Trichomonas vaginalis G3]|eukprot:XP_001310447.1 Myb-like DNA-binding domain containing protein [Trichomonas vaginalis G3]
MKAKNHNSCHMFTKDDDEMLTKITEEYMKLHKHINWDDISKQMVNKNPRQCKDRWFYYLNDKIDKSPFTPTENYILLWSINQIGMKWTQLTQLFPNRTDITIKSQYRKLMRRNATLENVFTLDTEKYYKQPRKDEDDENIRSLNELDQLFATFETEFISI